MKRIANWLVGEGRSGTPVRVNLSTLTEVYELREESGLRLYQLLMNADGDQNSVDIQGTMAEWDEVILGITPPERDGWVEDEDFEPTMRQHTASGRCVATVEGGLWYICGETATDEEMTPRYGSRVDAMKAVEQWWAKEQAK